MHVNIYAYVYIYTHYNAMKNLCVCIMTPYNLCVFLGACVYVSDKYREYLCIYLIIIQNVNVLHINLNPKLYKSTYL